MKKIIAVSVLTGVLIGGGVAWAATSWPASCSGFGCVNNHLNNLNSRVKTLQARLDALEACENAVLPVSRFGDETEGYLWGDDSPQVYFSTSALDVDDSGSPQYYVALVDPSCVATETAGPTTAGAGRWRVVEATSKSK